MAKVQVKSEVFSFYLKSYGLDANDLSEKTGIAADKVALWESSDSEISISLLRDIANVYKKHWAIFLLHEPPKNFKRPRDYRARSSHRQFGLISRLAFEEANRLINLASTYSLPEIDGRLRKLTSQHNTPEALAATVRAVLGIESVQDDWKRPEDAWNYCADKLEEFGMIISLQELDDGVDGFIVIKDEGVAIVVNRKMKNIYRRTFTLLHELGHYLQGVSAACDTSEIIHEVEAESYADTFSSNILVPSKRLLFHPVVLAIAEGKIPDEEDYKILSKKYCVSMSQIAVRLFKINLISKSQLDEQLLTAERLYKEKEEEKKRKSKASGGFDPKGHERKAINRVGRPLAATLLENYRNEKITVRDFSSSMGVKINLVGRIENMLGNERS